MSHSIWQVAVKWEAILLPFCRQREEETIGHLSSDGSNAWILQLDFCGV